MSNLTSGYQPIPGTFAEMITPNGGIRPHWQNVIQPLTAGGPNFIDSRWLRAQRIIRENGITFNAYEDPGGPNRPWELDPIPLVIDPDEWAFISEGIIQRMKILNRVLNDLYGEQTLLKNGTLPSDLIYNNPAFLRACSQVPPPDNQFLTLHAVDLARTPDGKWCVLKDHTQTPSGAGYALENRLVVSRTFPTIYRDCRVERLASFFISLRERLEELAPTNNASPRIVILTPGAKSPFYFEHAYLARYLGFPLVQGNDLTIRENKVFLKTLGGLQQVHVILRRQSDIDCDPLEMEGRTGFGIPGLNQAAAAGNVVVTNALGSGLAESPALLPFFPNLCRSLLNEEPKLPTIPSLWCGQAKERDQVIANLDAWVIKSAYSEPYQAPIFAHSLNPKEREAWVTKILTEPHKYIAQKKTFFSSTPCWLNGTLTPRYATIRAFVVATKKGWQVLPGGLVRTSPNLDSTVVTADSGGGSKDAWVLARGPVQPVTLMPKDELEVALSKEEGNLSSRVADNMFWLGRYIQRGEYQSRLIRTLLRRLTEETMPDGNPEIPELLKALAYITGNPEPQTSLANPVQEMEQAKDFIYGLIFDVASPQNLYNALTQAYRIGYTVRDRINIDTWRILDRMNRELHSTTRDSDLSDTLDMLDQLLIPLSAFSGLASESMTHGYGWRFMDMGFRLERAIMSAQILREMLVAPQGYEPPIFESVLEVANSLLTYKNRYQSRIALLPMLDLLINDSSNPRSISFQIESISEHIEALENLPRSGKLPEKKLAKDLALYVSKIDLATLIPRDEDGIRTELETTLNTIIERIEELSLLITQRYLAHVQATPQFSPLVRGIRFFNRGAK